jgi:hypothetical protein
LVCHINGRESLRVFCSTVLREVFGPKWEKVVRDWRKVHNDELHGLYKSLNFVLVIKSRVTRLAQKCIEGLVGKPEVKRPLARTEHR